MEVFMNIRHLKIFKTVCEENSLTKAAEKLYISQPAISNTIAELEKDLGTCLFDRISRKIQLNEMGKLFLSKTIMLLELYDDLEQNTKNLKESAAIKIGSSISIATYILPQAIALHRKVCANTPTNVIVENARTIENMVVENKVDLGLVEGVVEHKDLVDIPLSSYGLIVVCSPDYPLACEKSVDICTLAQENFLLREKGSAIRDVFDSTLLLHGLKIEPIWTSVNSEVLIAAVQQGLGLSVLPKIKVNQKLLSGEIVEIKVNGLEMSNSNHIIFHKGKYQTESFKKLVEIVQRVGLSCALE